MRHSIPFLFLLIACACGRVDSGAAIFESFVYRGAGECAAPDGFYANPVMKGFYPDPSICRKDGDYYMVNSTFQYFPAVPVWHSTDLVHWEQCSSVLTSDAQIAFTRKKMNLGNYAPSISYNPDDGLFYVACTPVSMPSKQNARLRPGILSDIGRNGVLQQMESCGKAGHDDADHAHQLDEDVERRS